MVFTSKLKVSINSRGRKAFTLAEILIVLGLLGNVAVLTIPTLLSETQTRVTVSSVKKAYSTLSQSYAMAKIENGTPEQWDLISFDSGPGAVIWSQSLNLI